MFIYRLICTWVLNLTAHAIHIKSVSAKFQNLAGQRMYTAPRNKADSYPKLNNKRQQPTNAKKTITDPFAWWLSAS